MNITPKTKAVGLLGHPVGHSLSPLMHNHLYKALDIDMLYMAYDVAECSLENAVDGMRALGYAGFNITIPYKEKVLKLLDIVDKEAEIIGAVNTVKIENGVLTGYNTDGQGFIQSLYHDGVVIKDKKVVLLGAGGSARSIGVYLAKECPESIYIFNRTYDKAKVLADLINNYIGRGIAVAATVIPKNADIIINTTNLGMWPNILGNPLQGLILNPRTIVCDIVYNPHMTAMLQYAAAFGCKTVKGIGMLVGQGIRAVEIWIDQPIPKESWHIMFQLLNEIQL